MSVYLAQWTKQMSTDIGDGDFSTLPENYVLEQNYPNPFNPSTTVKYSVPTRSQVTIEIFNVLGQRIKTLVDKTQSAGEYEVDWDGTNDYGSLQATGVYFYRLRAGEVAKSKKMLLLK